MTTSFERITTGILALAAVAVAASAVKSSFVSRAEARALAPDYVESWKKALPLAHAIGGDSLAPITLVTAVDFECPSCALFHQTVNAVVTARPSVVRAVYVAFPISYHRFAMPAARAAECAARVGRFAEWAEAVFSHRDSLGIKSWGQFAASAGIADTTMIRRCANDARPVPLIDAAMEFSKSIGVDATPTVLVNGWRFHQPPSRASLDSAIDAVLRKQKRG